MFGSSNTTPFHSNGLPHTPQSAGSQFPQQGQGNGWEPQSQGFQDLPPNGLPSVTGLEAAAVGDQNQMLDFNGEPGPDALVAAMVDGICTSFNLSDGYISQLHGFSEFTEGLSLPDRISRIYTVAAIFKVSMGTDPRAEQFAQIVESLKEIKAEFEAHFVLSEDQKFVVRTFAHDEIFKAKRMDFMIMHVDVLQRIMADRDNLGFKLVFKSPAREAILIVYIKVYCSGLRNQFRISLRDGATVGHKTAVTITKFTTDLAKKYMEGGAAATHTLDNENTAKCALLRHIVLQHTELLGIPEPSKQGARGDNSEPAEAPVNEEGTGKRKRQNGRPKDDDHFWSLASKFLEDKETELGTPFSSPEWKQFLNHILQEDIKIFGRPPAKDMTSAPANRGAGPTAQVPQAPAAPAPASGPAPLANVLSMFKRQNAQGFPNAQGFAGGAGATGFP